MTDGQLFTIENDPGKLEKLEFYLQSTERKY